MSTVHAPPKIRAGFCPKSAALYLIELRQHMARVHSRRQKLLISSWTAPEIHIVPIFRFRSQAGEGGKAA